MGKDDSKSWGYASYDVDNPDSDKLTYTRYEGGGGVNRYSDNGDGGHSHQSWKDANDYNSGKDPDKSRSESNKSKNPSTGDIQKDSGCYLTTACMVHYLDNFDDECYELRVLRWFRDNFISNEDIDHYYKTSPLIVNAISFDESSDLIYDYIYDNVVDYCVTAIENGEYEKAYSRYKDSILRFEETFIKKDLQERLIRILKNKAAQLEIEENI